MNSKDKTSEIYDRPIHKHNPPFHCNHTIDLLKLDIYDFRLLKTPTSIDLSSGILGLYLSTTFFYLM